MDEKLLDKYLNEKANHIYGYMIKKGCSKEDAEDIVQETLVKFYECLTELKENNISAWLFKVANNEFYNLMRKRKKRNQNIDFDLLLKNIKDEKENLEEEIIRQDDIKDFKNAFNKLKKNYQNLLYLKYFKELSYKEIACIEKSNEQNIKTSLYRARNRLKKEILMNENTY